MAYEDVYLKILIINEWTLTHFSCVSLTKTYQKISSYNSVQEILGVIYLRFLLKLCNSIKKKGELNLAWGETYIRLDIRVFLRGFSSAEVTLCVRKMITTVI